MKREDIMNTIRFAGYHNDWGLAIRTYVEKRVSRTKMEAAFAEGKKMKENGMPCKCFQCERKSGA